MNKFRLFFLAIAYGWIFFLPHAVWAITLEKAEYYDGEPIIFVSHNCTNPDVDAVNLFDLILDFNMGGFPCLGNDGDLVESGFEILFPQGNHRYAIVEVTYNGACEDVPDTYEECRARPEFVGEFIFTVKAIPGIRSVPLGILAHRPEATIDFPKEEDFAAGTTTIKYTATDEDNRLYPPFGFGETPIDLYYSDDKEQWIRIAENQQNLGEFQWDTTNLPDSEYWLKIVARDQSGEIDEEISGPFSLDTILPIFDVFVDPAISKGEGVTIKIVSSEPLLQSPEVFVKQRNFTDVPVFTSGTSTVWVGKYEVRSGADGTAKINVSGKDRAGNIGKTIRKGGIFSVGVEPPPTPILFEPADNSIATTSFIAIRGQAREDTKIFVYVNDKIVGTSSPDAQGEFAVQKIYLDQTVSKGSNIIKVVSEDATGNSSEPAVRILKFNFAPEIIILEPAARATTSATTTIEVSAKDKNTDKLIFTFEVSYDGGINFEDLVRDISRPVLEWNTREFPDGEYILRVTADDGFEKSIATSSPFFVQNFIPVISLDRKHYTNKTSLRLSGIASSPLRGGGRERASISLVEYSVDEGETWVSAAAEDGNFNSPSEKFDILLENLQEGEHLILVRSRDTRRLRGKVKTTVTVDFTPPATPVVNSPATGSIFGDEDDKNANVQGVQVKVSGRAEVESRIIIDAISGRSTSQGNRSSAAEAESGSDGSFSLEITLAEHQENLFEILVEDKAGNKSSSAELMILRNNPPDIKVLRPREGGGLNHKAEILFEIQDKDADPIKETVLFYGKAGEEIRRLVQRESGFSKGSLTSQGISKYIWDVSEIPEGRYELTIEANDGISLGRATRLFIVDNTPPRMNYVPLEKHIFSKEFILAMTGSATDNFSGIEAVEYRIRSTNNESGKNIQTEDVESPTSTGSDLGRWFKSTLTLGYRTRSAKFRLRHPFKLNDGKYEVSFRAVDSAGNLSAVPEPQKIIVDTTSPRIGSYILSSHNLNLLPWREAFEVPEGSRLEFKISLEEDTSSSTIYVGGQARKLEKRVGLWEAELKFGEVEPPVGKIPGAFPLTPGIEEAGSSTAIHVAATDHLGNSVIKEIGKIKIMPRGRVFSSESSEPIGDAELNIFVFDEVSKSWLPWQAEPYDLVNPVITESGGEYNLLLDSGKYELRLRKLGFKRANVSGFELAVPTFIMRDFDMEPRRGIRGKIEDLLEGLFSAN